MRLFQICAAVALSFIALFILSLRPSYSQTDVSEQTLASDILTEDKYQPGSGLPVGKIQLVWGEAFIFHRDPTVAFRVQAGLPVYAGDIIRSRANTRVQCLLIDGSRITLAPETDLTVGQSMCSSARKACNSFTYLKQGDARFKLKPPVDLVSYEFKVQTDLAAASVEAADFVVTATADAISFVSLENSRMEINSLSQPEEIAYLTDFQKTTFANNVVTSTVETVSGEEIETILAEFYPVLSSSLIAESSMSDSASEVSESQLLDE